MLTYCGVGVEVRRQPSRVILPPWFHLRSAVIRTWEALVSFETQLPVPWCRRPRRKSSIRPPHTSHTARRTSALQPFGFLGPNLVCLTEGRRLLSLTPPPGSPLQAQLEDGFAATESTREGRTFRLSKGQAADSVQPKVNFLFPGERELIATICFRGPRPAEGEA